MDLPNLVWARVDDAADASPLLLAMREGPRKPWTVRRAFAWTGRLTAVNLVVGLCITADLATCDENCSHEL